VWFIQQSVLSEHSVSELGRHPPECEEVETLPTFDRLTALATEAFREALRLPVVGRLEYQESLTVWAFPSTHGGHANPQGQDGAGAEPLRGTSSRTPVPNS
jgi:hypothetical protein